MSALPVKDEYGPSLGRLLSPRWLALSPPGRVLVAGALALVVAAIVGGVLTIEDAKLSHGGPVPFSFRYRGLYRAAPDPGGYARVTRYRGGRLADSFVVDPLHLPPYGGDLAGELPLLAADRIRTLAATLPGFDLQWEGKMQVNSVLAYSINYAGRFGGQLLYVREIFLLPQTAGARDGVDILMATRPSDQINVTSPVGAAGVLQLPFRSFALG